VFVVFGMFVASSNLKNYVCVLELAMAQVWSPHKGQGILLRGEEELAKWNGHFYTFVAFFRITQIGTFLRNFRVIYLALLYETIMAIGEWAKNG
jgi:hypothetical protein